MKSFNLTNKAATLLNFSLDTVYMDQDLCVGLMQQIPKLTNLQFLKINPYNGAVFIGGPYFESFSFSYRKEYCRIPKLMCAGFLRSISHLNNLVHLDLSGNNLTGCLSSLVAGSDSRLPSLQRLNLHNTGTTSNDVNHMSHIMEIGKLPNLEYLNLHQNGLRGMEDETDRLLNSVVSYHLRELQILLSFNSFPRHLVKKWETRYLNTFVDVRFIDERKPQRVPRY